MLSESVLVLISGVAAAIRASGCKVTVKKLVNLNKIKTYPCSKRIRRLATVELVFCELIISSLDMEKKKKNETYQQTSIPVPTSIIAYYDSSSENDFEWTLMEKIPGAPLRLSGVDPIPLKQISPANNNTLLVSSHRYVCFFNNNFLFFYKFKIRIVYDSSAGLSSSFLFNLRG